MLNTWKAHAGVLIAVGVAVVVVAVLAAGLAGFGGRTSAAEIPAQCPAAPGSPSAPLFSAARSRFVRFAPSGVLLCLYVDGSPGLASGGVAPTLSTEVRITDAASALKLADDLDAAARASLGVRGCGNDSGARVDAYFQGDGQSVEVLISGLPGCSLATNGPKDAAIGNSEIVPELQVLLGLDIWPGAGA